jgi:hypothetical protein
VLLAVVTEYACSPDRTFAPGRPKGGIITVPGVSSRSLTGTLTLGIPGPNDTKDSVR